MKCPECSHEIKITQKSCSNCGFPISMPIQKRFAKWIKDNSPKKNLAFAGFCILAIFICVLIINALILQSRLTFDSVDEMQECLKGTWQEVGDSKKIVFRGSEATEYWKYQGLELTADVEYNNKRGYIEYISTRYYLKESKSGSLRLVSSEETFGKISDSTSAPAQEPR